MNTISNDPYIYYIDNLLTDDECDFIIHKSKDKLKKARVSYLEKDKHKFESNKYTGRTNSSYWLRKDLYPESHNICKKIAKLLNCDWNHFEDFQVIHYGENEKYDYHYDAYNKNNPEKYEKFCKDRGNRKLTVLIYLNDVEKGGGTGFDKLPNYDDTIIIQPKKGRVVIFYNINDDGSLNLGTRHAGLPVIKGEKWACNLWLREK